MEIAKLQRDRLVDAVYQSLRQAILDSTIPPSERLNVEELAQKLGVSLTPVRHAVQQLATEGLVEIKPRSGTFVTQLSAQNVEETLEIRRALECLAVETAIEKITREDLRRQPARSTHRVWFSAEESPLRLRNEGRSSSLSASPSITQSGRVLSQDTTAGREANSLGISSISMLSSSMWYWLRLSDCFWDDPECRNPGANLWKSPDRCTILPWLQTGRGVSNPVKSTTAFQVRYRASNSARFWFLASLHEGFQM
jgi:DNA-binding transcriptional regulator YhcF (GntR family)